MTTVEVAFVHSRYLGLLPSAQIYNNRLVISFTPVHCLVCKVNYKTCSSGSPNVRGVQKAPYVNRNKEHISTMTQQVNKKFRYKNAKLKPLLFSCPKAPFSNFVIIFKIQIL